VTEACKVTACQGAFKKSLCVMETYVIDGILNMGVENSYFCAIVLYLLVYQDGKLCLLVANDKLDGK
jgi:hypothetical protein